MTKHNTDTRNELNLNDLDSVCGGVQLKLELVKKVHFNFGSLSSGTGPVPCPPSGGLKVQMR